MIKFFRKIRQKLLEQNRVSKYLLYAFGEIILVVIGILIALQINNWNEDRKAKNLEQNYLNNLMSELSNQLLLFEAHKAFEVDKTKEMADIISNYNTNKGFIRHKAELDKLGNLFGAHYVRILNSTFLEMQSSGNLKLISDKELLSKITQFYQDLTVHEKITQNNYSKMQDYLIDPLIKNSIFPDNERFGTETIAQEYKIGDIENDELYKVSFELLSDPKIALQITNGISYRKAVSLNLIKRAQEKIDQTKHLITLIDNSKQ